ncbi:glycoside hydrolase family 31 protein [Streptomyces boninensis]|uniref:glycoside hydrolase family 31 protein n=1 Tax=Streptomyces boninensis TaxID=2039455 RepID=UPI003B21241D
MNARALLRSWRTAYRQHRAGAAVVGPQGHERARVPGAAVDAVPLDGGGLLHFSRSSLLVRVAAGGAVFCGWDGAEPEPSYALVAGSPEPDARATLEPDKDGGWRVVSERVLVAVSRHGAVELRTPGGALLRRLEPPRWWERESRAEARWLQRSRLPADARCYGPAGEVTGSQRLYNLPPGADAEPLTMPVQWVMSDAGSHLLFHDTTWDGRLAWYPGEEGAGSGHDRAAGCELRMDGGPLRYWVLAGAPSRIVHSWIALTGAPAVPPPWAHGHHAAGVADADRLRELTAGHAERDLPLSAVHLTAGKRPFAVPAFTDLATQAARLRADGVRLVCEVAPDVPAEPGDPAYDTGTDADVFVHDTRGHTAYPDFTDPGARKWWGGLYAEGSALGFAGVAHTRNEPDLPPAARHSLESRGGDHREAHNAYALTMARAGHEALSALRPAEPPFLLSRSGWAGLQRYGGTWTEAPADWAGLRAALRRTVGLGLCGVPFAGLDVAGDDELYLRTLQLACLLPFVRTHSAPWEHRDPVPEHARAILRARTRLAPYLRTLAHLAHLTGAPYARPLWWQHPFDRQLRACDDAFLLGDALLVAPVLDPGARRRAVPLPPGRWYDTATGRTHSGGRAVLEAPLDRIPVLARAGSVLPVTGADGRVVLEVWAPAPGRTGTGALAVEDARGEVHLERFTARRTGGVTVARDDGTEPGRPVRLRGL